MTKRGKEESREKLVAVVSPWVKLGDVVKRDFRVQSLPAEKTVMAWRDDLQTPEALAAELAAIGITPIDIRTKAVTATWQEID
jgi:hypothetical protein